MTPFLLRSRPLAFVLLLLAGAGALLGATDRKRFTTPPTLAAEASTLTKLLDELHYNRDAVRSADYANVVPDYMGELDGQRLFFLGSDRARFMEEFSKNVYYNAAFLGHINAAYEIFYVYQERVEQRVAWILARLEQPLDLTADETYRVDRQKAEWPADAAAADDLWVRRLKFEVIQEILAKKSPEEAKAQIRKRYERMLRNVGEIEGNELAELFLTTIAKLYDPHSTYFSAATYEDFGIQMKLQLVGIGAVLGTEDDVCVVKEIIPGGPADLGRELKPNDKIIAVAEKGGEPFETFGLKLRKVVERIRGKKGTDVVLTVQPADGDSSVRKQVVITRDKVKINSARARGAIFDLPGDDGKTQPVGVITLPAFYGPADEGDTDGERTTASRDVARLIEQFKQAGIEGLVLDLRRNGGGFLTEAVELAGLFINRGPVVQIKAYNGEIHVDNDRDPRIAYAGPLAVLVDRFSASASEIVAGALQNYGRAIVVGDSSTHGKGSVQQVVEMKQLSRALSLAPRPGRRSSPSRSTTCPAAPRRSSRAWCRTSPSPPSRTSCPSGKPTCRGRSSGTRSRPVSSRASRWTRRSASRCGPPVRSARPASRSSPTCGRSSTASRSARSRSSSPSSWRNGSGRRRRTTPSARRSGRRRRRSRRATIPSAPSTLARRPRRASRRPRRRTRRMTLAPPKTRTRPT